MQMLHLAGDALSILSAAPDVLTDGWDPKPKAPPGMEDVMPEWIGWAKYIAIGAGIIGLITCGIMMMVGRRNRSHMSAEGAVGSVWVLAGLSVVSLAGGVVPAILGA